MTTSEPRPGALAFTDIAGFTAFTAASGDAAALALLERQEELVRAALPEGGRIVKSLGDGLMLWFPRAAPALRVGLELRATFEQAADAEMPLWVRMGMHWGAPTARGDDFFGHDVNLAARITELAGPGELLISEHLCAALDRPVAG
ncbi:MAG: adenylate/guanylate cyclase domain-containing protein, partial [Acidimicrobiia bacterium]